MQHREDDLQGALSGLLLDVHGDAAAVVAHADHVPLLDRHFDRRAEAGQRLVDGVVDDLIDQMVQTGGGGGADIHTGPLAHRLQTFQHLDLRSVIFLFQLFDIVCHI